MGKTLPTPYPGQSMDEYREQLVNFQKNYWSFLKPSKGGSKFIPLPPEHLKPKEMRPNIIPAIVASNKKNKIKEMSSRKLSEHVEQELFDKEKRVKLNEGVEPKIKKVVPKPPQSEPRVIKEGEQPVKKKKPYYRKKYTKPTPVEVVVPEPVNKYLFIKGLLVGSVLTAIICHIIYSI
jgi:hypothetical protein